MRVEKKDTFDPTASIWIKKEREIEACMPFDRQHKLSCGGCGEAWELADDVLRPNPLFTDPFYTRRRLGIVCPKCGLRQAVGHLSRLCIFEVAESRPLTNLAHVSAYADNAHLFGKRVKTPNGFARVSGFRTQVEVSYEEKPDPQGHCSAYFDPYSVELAPESDTPASEES